MDKRVIRERMRRKRRQLFIRRVMRQSALVIGGVLAMILLVKGIIAPIAGRIGGKSKEPATVEAQAQPQEVNTYAAMRMPIRGAKDISKAAVKTVGWQEDSSGKWYQCSDGSYYAGGMQDIDGQTYYFDENGYLAKGWITLGDMDYWFNDDGSLDPSKQREMVALTFDDGPGERTMELLEFLEQHNARATFFMQGINLETYASAGIPAKMKAIGCELGNHSYDHANMVTLTTEQVQQEFDRVDELLMESAGSPSTVVRFPYGSYDENVLDTVGKPSFMWDIDTLDWQTHNADNTYDLVMNNVSDGDIILLHDIHTESIDAAKRLVPALQEAGYKLVTVSEMAKAKGVTLQPGGVYTDFMADTVTNLKATQGYTDSTTGSYIDNYTESSDSSSENFDNEGGDFESE